jgi:hypothetical protein
MKTKRSLLFICIFICLNLFNKLLAQAQSGNGNQVKQSAERIQKNSVKLEETSAIIKENVEKVSSHVKEASGNYKAVVKIFEPILFFHRKKTIISNNEQPKNNIVVENPDTTKGNISPEVNPPVEEIFIPESKNYNSDGSINLGCQHHKEFGCYLDLGTGTVLDNIDAAGNSVSVDLIYTSTDYFGSAPMYAFLSPAMVKNDFFANYYFRGPAYKDQNIPIRQWDEVNESEIALTNITAAQFDKIKDNNQLLAVIKQISAFKDRLESRSTLIGKTIAVKTKMGNRDVAGLIHILDQYGTTGTNAYLKIKIKVTGLDKNGDGIPDGDLYE